jgi:hypothetical protein
VTHDQPSQIISLLKGIEFMAGAILGALFVLFGLCVLLLFGPRR